ncbi:MAG: fibrobacter succinogenes major paralogous domain-containing protein [Bacteroidales bacterium]|nr:fibrobacter succinogenes major paralogous domain-containing protein [Bacteroidales bacterium]
MKKITLILILIATFATKSFAYCPIPQWCPSAPLHQTLCPGDTIETIEFPSVIAKTLIINWWTDGTRFASINTPDGITVSGPPDNREHLAPVSIKGAPTVAGTHHYTVSNTCGVELLHGSITLNAAPSPTGCDFCTSERNLVNITSASFATAQTWSPGTSSLVWSDAVISPQCTPRGDAYNGGADPNFNVDCRDPTNGFNGHYFSWCAVMKFADILCPGDWRVPTTAEFLELHLTLGHSAPETQTGYVPVIASTYMGTTGTGGAGGVTENHGGSWGGSRFTADAADLPSASSSYWSSSEYSSSRAFNLHYNRLDVWPQRSYNKFIGFALRCVRDVP